MLELTDGRVVGVSDTPLGFRHGPKTIIDAKTLIVMFLCNDPYTRAYELDVLSELRRDGIAARVIALTGNATGAAADEIRLPEAATATDLELCFPFAVFAQSLALQQSLALGFEPDSPNARGVVNRVVQGVEIYPWTPQG
jgi:tagatose-6-phosphate ketose/aldose isomerase